MEIIQDISKNTYQITFKREVAYDWLEIALVLIEQPQPYEFLRKKLLINNEESQEEVLYWQDLFFMEVAEQHNELDIFIIEKIKGHELYKANLKFLNTLPKATLPLGRELLIDQLISVSDEESIIPDHIIEMVVKKKSRDDLRGKFKEWSDEIPETSEVDTDENKKPSKYLKFQYFKYLIAASIVAFGLFIWQPTKSSDDELFAYYNSSLENLTQDNLESLDYDITNSTTRGDDIIFQNYSPIESENIIVALSYFKDKNYDQAKARLGELKPKGKNNQILFFLALSQLNTNDVEESIANLEFLKIQEDFNLLDDVKFHLAMAYLKKGNRNSSKNLLKDLKSSDSNVSSEAKIILDKMRWF
jgi:hypothetical protein